VLVSAIAFKSEREERFISKQDSDNLMVSEEKISKQTRQGGQAQTHLYDFKVRKSPPVYLNEESPSLQIPKNAFSKEQQMMFLHPYQHMGVDQMSEDSTHFNSKRNADSESATGRSRKKSELSSSQVSNLQAQKHK